MLLRAALSLLLLILVAGRSAAGESLPERLEAALADPALRGARIAALVEGCSDGSVVYARSPERALIPASNTKILTALAALSRLGPAHRFKTRVYSDVEPGADGEVGVLAVRGGGDPGLRSEEWWRLAADLRRAGLRRVRGPLLLDDSLFDRERWHPSWGSVSSRAYHAPVGALSANYGAFAVEVRPGPEPGAPARVEVDPPTPYFEIASRPLTGPHDARGSLRVGRKREGEREKVVTGGRVPLGADPQRVYRSVADPTRYAGAVLRMQLEAVGVRVDGPTRLGPVPEAFRELLEFEGPPLADSVRLFLKYSSNSIGEMLVKALGAAAGVQGSWPAGLSALRRELASLGFDPEEIVIEDGSGLSYHNRLAPETIVHALRIAAGSFRFGPELVAALPIAARDGTLEERIDGAAGVLRAKTGLLDRVTALSGYARTRDGAELVFSVLVNGYRVDDEAAMRALDRFAEALVGGGASEEAQSGDTAEGGSGAGGGQGGDRQEERCARRTGQEPGADQEDHDRECHEHLHGQGRERADGSEQPCRHRVDLGEREPVERRLAARVGGPLLEAGEQQGEGCEDAQESLLPGWSGK